MRAYGTVSPQFWIGATGKALRRRPDAQRVAFYLQTCPSASMTGLYYLPLSTLCHEIGIAPAKAEAALAVLASLGFADYDHETETVWVREMARFQIAPTLKPEDKRIKGVMRELEAVATSPFVSRFIEKYRAPFNIPDQAPSGSSGSPQEAPSGSPKSPIEGPSEPLRSQDQEQDQDQDQDQEQEQEGGVGGTASASRSARDLKSPEASRNYGPEETLSGPSVTALDRLLEVWNANRGTLAGAGRTKPREAHARVRLQEVSDLERWAAAIRWLAQDEFHSGGGSRGWRADFDWILKPGNLVKIEEKMAAPAAVPTGPRPANYHSTPGRYAGVTSEKL